MYLSPPQLSVIWPPNFLPTHKNLFSFVSARSFPRAIQSRHMFDGMPGRHSRDIVKWNKCSYLFGIKEYWLFKRINLKDCHYYFFGLVDNSVWLETSGWRADLNQACLFLIFKNSEVSLFLNSFSEPQLCKYNKRHPILAFRTTGGYESGNEANSLPIARFLAPFRSSNLNGCSETQLRSV